MVPQNPADPVPYPLQSGLSLRHHTRAAIAALLCVLPMAAGLKTFAAENEPLAAQPAQGASDAAFELFLDYLMRAESNGRDTATNPRSTALGAFQFIESTFLAVTREHFPREVAELSDQRLLELRTNRNFSRRAAAAYCKQNAAYLTNQGLQPTFGHLRLAYLLGAVGAAKVMKAPPQTSVAELLSVSVIRANPFMTGMTAADLNEKAHRDIRWRPDMGAIAARRTGASGSQAVTQAGNASCNPGLASCRHWLALRGPPDAAQSVKAAKPAKAPGKRVQDKKV
jgi:hypothetical protein